jgi:hypothetical protein
MNNSKKKDMKINHLAIQGQVVDRVFDEFQGLTKFRFIRK